jgi:multidrug efflux pump
MSNLQQSVVKNILQDPAVESLSSFIGIDGTNTTMNSGRIQINLKPLAQRKMSASDVIRRLQQNVSGISGITLYMQPVQDLSVDDRVSRTQFQYTLEDPSADELNSFAPKLLAKLQQLPELSDVASDQQTQGIQARLLFDRPTASRFGITASAIDQTLYDAYGQREISTMFTQLNQYHVVLEVKPGFDQRPLDLRDLYIRSAMAGTSAATVSGGVATTNSSGPSSTPAASSSATVSGPVAGGTSAAAPPSPLHSGWRTGSAERLYPVADDLGAHRDQSSGTVSSHHAVFQPRAQRFAGRRHRCREQGERQPGNAAEHRGRVSGNSRGIHQFTVE